jgi:2-iminobutanoate/2-iminopropanoate deaminase
MAATLSESGTSFSGVARLAIYVKNDNQDMFPTIRTVRGQFADVESPPASALIGVEALTFPEILIEVDALA